MLPVPGERWDAPVFEIVKMLSLGDLSGSVPSLLTPGVRLLAPEETAFETMLRGWEMQQGSRFFEGGDGADAPRRRAPLPRGVMVEAFAR